jgi:uncharacterized protein YecE (DUF72 family)
MKIKVGNCGWSYLNVSQFLGPDWNKKFSSKLQAYAHLFDVVEINSTFYSIPKLTTVERWRAETDQINKKFEFTIKCSQLITHKKPFQKQAFWAYSQMVEIAKILRAKVLLFQSPSNFKPTKRNIDLAKKFFEKIERDGLILVWEVRWAKTWTEQIVKKLFSEIDINQCVDPLRQDCFYSKNIFYYRLHGFGKPSMYNYSFSKEELEKLANKVKAKKPVYVLFNNTDCYKNALEFKNLFLLLQ